MFNYDLALVRGLPASFPQGLVLHPPPEPVDMGKAHEQHKAYTDLLKRLITEGKRGEGAGEEGGSPRVVEVAADESCPDCVFIEVLSQGGRASPLLDFLDDYHC